MRMRSLAVPGLLLVCFSAALWASPVWAQPADQDDTGAKPAEKQIEKKAPEKDAKVDYKKEFLELQKKEKELKRFTVITE